MPFMAPVEVFMQHVRREVDTIYRVSMCGARVHRWTHEVGAWTDHETDSETDNERLEMIFLQLENRLSNRWAGADSESEETGDEEMFGSEQETERWKRSSRRI